MPLGGNRRFVNLDVALRIRVDLNVLIGARLRQQLENVDDFLAVNGLKAADQRVLPGCI
jgi:hypothetical protein